MRKFVWQAACWLTVVAGCLLGSASLLSACSVPVFRYGLERWPADLYRVTVFHRGELSTAEQAGVEEFQKQAEVANLTLELVDLDEPLDGDVEALWNSQEEQAELPWVVVSTPKQAEVQKAVWSGKFEAESLAMLLDSPLRREAARRILQGESAVWILLESGDPEKDDAAAEFLERHLATLQQTLNLPDQNPSASPFAPPDGDALDDVELSDDVELKLAFSLLRLSRDDPHEELLMNMLLATEPDLEELQEHPMAFPVFSRGRALYALVGAGINEETVTEACEFLIGPCSCQVKDQNPGADLLMTVAWESLIEGRAVIDRELPPLAGISRFADLDDDEMPAESAGSALAGEAEAGSAVADTETAVPSEAVSEANRSESEASDGGNLLSRNLMAVIGLSFMAIVFATVFLSMRNRG